MNARNAGGLFPCLTLTFKPCSLCGLNLTRNNMTNEEMNIAINQHFGWRFAGDPELDAFTEGWVSGAKVAAGPFADFVKWNESNDPRYFPVLVGLHSITNYSGCLNAMHEAEGDLPDSMEQAHFETLHDVAGDLDFYKATAAQRAEAFLRTVGKWKEDA